jgi:hypothetical protein
MKLDQATEKMKTDILKALEEFKVHYIKGINTTDYYPEELNIEEWYEQFQSFFEMETEDRLDFGVSDD